MKKFIGDKKFYKMLFIVVIPLVLQQIITQFVGLLDNLMIGQVGTSEMTGVSLANQLLFIVNLGIFGSLSGISIFATQLYGAKNVKGYQETFRFKWIVAIIIFIITTIVFIFFSENLLNFFINNEDTSDANPIVVIKSAKLYLYIMIFGNLPFFIKEIYATSLREMKETFVPMISGIIAIFVNLIFNYLLIFGHMGFPTLGILGGAIATIISRIVELAIVVIYVEIKKDKFTYFIHIFRGKVCFKSVKKMLPKMVQLMANEVLWALGLTLILSAYSYRGLGFVAAFNICNTVNNVFLTIGTSFGNATAIILGNKLGEKDIDGAKNSSYKILAFSVVVSIIFSVLMICSSFILPDLYNTSLEVKNTAKNLIFISACFIPVHTFNTCCYFTLRSGGKIILTILFDSAFVLLIRVPLAYILSIFTPLNIYIIYTICTGIDTIKVFIGYILVDKGIWLKLLV